MILSSDLQQKPILCKPLRAFFWRKDKTTSAFREFSLQTIRNWAASSESSLFWQGLTFSFCYKFLKTLFSGRILCIVYLMVVIVNMNLYFKLELLYMAECPTQYTLTLFVEWINSKTATWQLSKFETPQTKLRMMAQTHVNIWVSQFERHLIRSVKPKSQIQQFWEPLSLRFT